MAMPTFNPAGAVDGELPPWAIAKTFALHVVIHTMSEELGTPAHDLVGGRTDQYIAQQVRIKGGGHPSSRQIRRVVQRCQDPSWKIIGQIEWTSHPSREPQAATTKEHKWPMAGRRRSGAELPANRPGMPPMCPGQRRPPNGKVPGGHRKPVIILGCYVPKTSRATGRR